MRRRTAALHTLVGAYVMDAVPPADRVAFERHLSGCAACQDEVRGMREATARLAAAAAIEPRPELRAQTLQAATRLRQAPPLVDEPAGTGLAGLVLRIPGRRAAVQRAEGQRTPGSGPRRVFQSGWLAVMTGVAVVFAVAAIGLGLHLGSMQHQMTAADQRDHTIAAILGAPDAVTLTAAVRSGGTATVVMSHHADSLVFVAHKLPGLPASRGYELWLMGPTGNRPAGMLPAAKGGMSGPMVVSGLRAGDKVGLTVEPAAGASRPTSPPVVMVGLGD
jgi:anti-sigma factor RsiW